MKMWIPSHSVEVGNDSLTFKGFVLYMVARHRDYNSDAEGIRSSVRLQQALDTEDPYFLLDRADYARLKKVVEKPGDMSYPVSPAVGCLPWIDAIANASVYVPPTPEAAEDAEDAEDAEAAEDA